MRDSSSFEINIDRDTADARRIIAFINQKVRAPSGRPLGAIGIGVDVRSLSNVLRHIENRYNSEVLIASRSGRILLSSHGNAFSGLRTLADLPGLKPRASIILSSDRGSFRYEHDGNRYFIESRRIPELDWWLVVRQRINPNQGGLLDVLFQNLVIASLVTLMVLLLAKFTISDYQRRLRLLATTDRLTGLLNRTAFDNLFDAVTSAARRRRAALVALLVDIDHFKAINDSHGHAAGDRAIRHVCDCMAARIRSSDLLFRWGGEEFLLLLPDCSGPDGEKLARQLCRTIREQPLHDGDTPVPITVSIGISTWRDGEGAQDLLMRADRALYSAKAHGRDRVVMA